MLESRAADLGIPVHSTICWRVEHLDLDAWGSRFTAAGRLSLTCPLPGAHQVENALAAALALTELGINDGPFSMASQWRDGRDAWNVSPDGRISCWTAPTTPRARGRWRTTWSDFFLSARSG